MDLDDEELKATRNKFYPKEKIEKLKDIKERYNKSNKFVLYLDYYDIGLLFKYIEDLENEKKDENS